MFTIPVFATVFICTKLALSLILNVPPVFTFTASVTVNVLVPLITNFAPFCIVSVLANEFVLVPEIIGSFVTSGITIQVDEVGTPAGVQFAAVFQSEFEAPVHVLKALLITTFVEIPDIQPLELVTV